MTWQKFNGVTEALAQSYLPLVRVDAELLLLNTRAWECLGKPSRVALLYDADSDGVIAIRAAYPNEQKTISVFERPNRPGLYHVKAIAFGKFVGLPQTRTSYVASVVDDMLVIDLDDPA